MKKTVIIILLCLVTFGVGCWYISKTLVINISYQLKCSDKQTCMYVGDKSTVKVSNSIFYGGVDISSKGGTSEYKDNNITNSEVSFITNK